MRSAKVTGYWYDPEDQEWKVTATYWPPRAGTYWDPPEGDEMEDMEFVRAKKDGTVLESLDQWEFCDRFGQKALDKATQNLIDTLADEADEGEDPPDLPEWEPDDIRDDDF